MSCFKKDGTIKKIYMSLIPLIENAEPNRNVITVNNTFYNYQCRRFEAPKDREKYITALFDELGIGYKIWPVSSDKIAVDIINNDEVLGIVRQAV